MAETSSQPIVSVSDLPPEVLEMLAPYLTSKDISALRCVNKYFNQVFNNDIFWKQYLHYPEKYFLCDLKSSSTAPGVKDIREEISQGSVGKWQGYYKLQKTHLHNWESGLSYNYHIIPVSPSFILRMKDMVDDNGEHWLFFCDLKTVHIWNVTAVPRALKSVIVGRYNEVHLLSMGIVIRERRGWAGYSTGVIEVYHFKNPTYDLNLQFAFVYHMDSVNVPLNNLPIDYGFKFLTTGHIFIGYKRNGFSLHVWDLNSGSKLIMIDLSEFEIVKAFVDLNKIDSSGKNNMDQEHLLFLHRGQYPFIIISLYQAQKRISQVYIFSVETMQLTHFIAQLPKVSSCFMYSNRVVILDVNKSVSIYSVCKEPVDSVLSSPIVPVHGKRLKYLPFCFNKLKVQIKNSKVVISHNSGIEIIDLSSEVIEPKTIEFDSSYRLLGFVEPNLLLMINMRTTTEVKVYNVDAGEVVCQWNTFNLHDCLTFKYFKHLQCLNKLVLATKTEFRVFNF